MPPSLTLPSSSAWWMTTRKRSACLKARFKTARMRTSAHSPATHCRACATISKEPKSCRKKRGDERCRQAHPLQWVGFAALSALAGRASLAEIHVVLGGKFLRRRSRMGFGSPHEASHGDTDDDDYRCGGQGHSCHGF